MMHPAKIDADGRLFLPADILERQGLRAGADVVLEDGSDGIVIRSVANAVGQAQAWSRTVLADYPDASVDAFIAERRRTAEAE